MGMIVDFIAGWRRWSMGNGENEADEVKAPGVARAPFKARAKGPAPRRKVPTATSGRMYSRPLSIMATRAGGIEEHHCASAERVGHAQTHLN
jgi:hypothetical protein